MLGFFQNDDAPNFGLDVSVQKARTAAFFSSESAGLELSRAGLGAYLRERCAARRPRTPTRRAPSASSPSPSIRPESARGFGPVLAADRAKWSPFNTGLQLDLLNLGGTGRRAPRSHGLARTASRSSRAAIPLYKDGRLAGAIGVSGDGVDQDDLIAAAGGASFEVPAEKRSDQLVVRGVRLPWAKFPRHPEL